MSGSHYAPEPDSTQYDLRTATEHENADVTALRQMCDRLQEALNYLSKRVDDLTSAAMTDLGNTSHQVAALRSEVDGVVRIATSAERQAAAHERRLTAVERSVQAMLTRQDDGK